VCWSPKTLAGIGALGRVPKTDVIVDVPRVRDGGEVCYTQARNPSLGTARTEVGRDTPPHGNESGLVGTRPTTLRGTYAGV